MQSSVWLYFVAIGCGYIVGSCPSGYLVGRGLGIDIRKHGSGNIGATNVLRVIGKKWGYLVFALDALKGVLAVRLAFGLATSTWFSPARPEMAACVSAKYFTP